MAGCVVDRSVEEALTTDTVGSIEANRPRRSVGRRMTEGPREGIPGLPPGVLPAVLAILRRASAPIRRRRLLEELEREGHRISLAGLNRVLQQCSESGLTVESDAGVRLKPTS
jgi:hypothetical protein